MKSRRKSSRLGYIERGILQELSTSDLLVGFLLSGRSTKTAHKIAHKRAIERYRRKLAVQRLTDQGFIRNHGEIAGITDAGRRIIEQAAAMNNLGLPREWDKKWRIVSYDIPERYKHLRDIVRNILKRAGFIKLQHSIWIFPYESEELARLIQRETKLEEFIVYGVLIKIGGEERLKAHFKL